MHSRLYLILAIAIVLTLPSCDPNEYAPEVGDQLFYLDENSAIGTIVGQIEAFDPDEGQKIGFLLENGNTDEAFELDPTLGTLKVRNAAALNFEKHPRFDLEIVVSDSHSDDSKSATATVTVFLNNLNEYAPEMEDHSFTVEEKSSKGTLIGTISATDADPGQVLSFRIISGNESGFIELDSLKGEIRVQDSTLFHYDLHSKLEFTLEVTDNDSIMPLRDTATLVIQVIDVPELLVDFSGVAQKGPFILGSQINVHELDSAMVATGRVFSTQISDNSGYFELAGIELESPYVRINANGFYYNEISGVLSEAQLDLNSTLDLREETVHNVNVLSHLEEARLQDLLHQGYGFSEAKGQAREEALFIFEFTSIDQIPSEGLDIAQAGEDNAMLLAASIILQGDRNTAEFSEMLNQVRLDFEEDGILDNETIGTALVDGVLYQDLVTIRQQLEDRYAELGQSYVIPDFEKYIRQFLEETSFKATELPDPVTFPLDGLYGLNALHPDVSQVESEPTNGRSYSFAVDVSEGHSYLVKVIGWGSVYTWGSLVNMENYAETEPVRFARYSTTASGNCDAKIQFHTNQEYSNILTLEYFLDGASEPYFTKQLEILNQTIPVDPTSTR